MSVEIQITKAAMENRDLLIDQHIYETSTEYSYVSGKEFRDWYEEHKAPDQHLHVELFAEHPGLLKKVDIPAIEGVSNPDSKWREIPIWEVENIKDLYVVLADGPAYTELTSKWPKETAQLYEIWRQKKRDLIRSDPAYKGLIMMGSAGDEDSFATPIASTNPLALIAFSLESQALFAETLSEHEEFNPLKEHLNKVKETDRPHIIIAITHGDMAVSVLETAPDPDGDNDAVLTYISPEINVGKKLAKGGVHLTKAKDTATLMAAELKTSTSEFSTVNQGANDRLSTVSLDTVEDQLKYYQEYLEKIGVEVIVPDENNPNMQIVFPREIEGISTDDMSEQELLTHLASLLKKEIATLENDPSFEDPVKKKYGGTSKWNTEFSQETLKVKSIDKDALLEMQEKFSWEIRRDGVEPNGPQSAIENYGIQGLARYREILLDPAGPLDFIEDNDLRRELSSKMISHIVRYILYSISRETSENYIKIENNEVNGEDEINFIFNHNIQKPDPTGDTIITSPDVLASIARGVLILEDEEFYNEIPDYLAHIFYNEINISTGGKTDLALLRERFSETLEGLRFNASPGFYCAETDSRGGKGIHVSDLKTDPGIGHSGPPVVGDMGTSAASRLGGQHMHGRSIRAWGNRKKRKDAGEDLSEEDLSTIAGWEPVIEEVAKTYGQNMLVMTDEARRSIGIPDELALVAKGVKLKGRPLQNIAHVRPRDYIEWYMRA